MTEPQQEPVGHTRHTDLTLDQIADMQPGMARLMPEVSDRYWILYYAAQGGNWKLARHELSELRSTLRIAATTRPKYKAALETFTEDHLAAIGQAIESQDIAAFETAYRNGVEVTNEYHREFGHGEIVWQLPDEPPKHLKLTP